MDTPNYPSQQPWSPSQPPSPPPPWYRDRFKVTVLTVVGVSAVVVIALLLMVLNARGGEGAVASASPTPSASAPSSEPSPSESAAEPSISVEPSSSVEATPSASAEPSVVPQAELVQGWAVINTGLNLRSQGGQEYAVITKLQPREVVWVDSGPYREEDADDDLQWYYVSTTNEKSGWIASGAPDDPHATNISNQFRYRSCGSVELAGNVGLVNGLRTGHLNERERATFTLAQAMGTDGCITFSNESYPISARVSVDVQACGAPSWDGSVMRLQPTTAGNVDSASRVDTTIVVPNALLLSGQRADANGLTNHHKVLILGSDLPSPIGCIKSEMVRRDTNSRRTDVTTETSGCMAVLSREVRAITFAPVGGDAVSFVRSGSSLNTQPLNDPAVTRLVQNPQALASQVLSDC